MIRRDHSSLARGAARRCKGSASAACRAGLHVRTPPWETVDVAWDGGQRKQLWVFSRTALWYTPGWPPVAIRDVLVADPAGQLRMAAFLGTALQATAVEIWPGVVRRWSVEVTCEEARAHLGVEPQRQWSDQALARTAPVLLARCSLVTVLALQWSGDEPIPVPGTAWDHTIEPPVVACVALVRRHLWRARSWVHSAPQAEFGQCPREAFDQLLTGLPSAA